MLIILIDENLVTSDPIQDCTFQKQSCAWHMVDLY